MFIITVIQAKEISDPQTLAGFETWTAVVWILFIILGLFFNGCVTCLSWNRVRGAEERGAMLLLMAYAVFFCPMIFILLTDLTKGQYSKLWDMVGRVARYSVCVTNGLIIYFSRPVYRMAFQYFTRTNPLQWKKIERFNQKLKSIGNISVPTATVPVFTKEPTISPLPSELTSQILNSQSKQSTTV